MRLRPPTFLVPLVLALATDVAPGACEDAFPPPAGFAAEIKPGVGAGAAYVSITWTPDQTVHEGVNFSNYRLERRDVTAGGGFASIYTSTFRYSGLTTQAIADPSHDPPCVSANGCVEPGHTYAYRIFVQFTYSVGCPLHDGQLHDSAPSSEATLVVPGGAAGKAPRDVLAIADTKKPRVTVSWSPPEGPAPAAYEVRRRIASPAKGTKAEAEFERVVRVRNKVTEFVDKKVSPDEVIEYVVAAVSDDGQLYESAYDIAYAIAPRCPKSKFAVWDGLYAFTDPSGIARELLLSGSAEPRARLYQMYDPGEEDSSGVTVTGKGRAKDGGAKFANYDLAVEHLSADHIGWSRALTEKSVGSLRVHFPAANPFDELRFRRLDGSLEFEDRDDAAGSLEFQAERRPVEKGVTEVHAEAALCATVGASKRETLVVGEDVILLYELVNLGPEPLFSRRATLDVSVTNGELREFIGPWYESVDDVAGKTVARFSIGAIGPVSATRSEVATLALRVRAGRPPGTSRPELQVIFTLLDFETAPYAGDQTLEIDHPVRIVELRVANPAKR